MREIPTNKAPPAGPHATGEKRALREVPLFLGLRARRFSHARTSLMIYVCALSVAVGWCRP